MVSSTALTVPSSWRTSQRRLAGEGGGQGLALGADSLASWADPPLWEAHLPGPLGAPKAENMDPFQAVMYAGNVASPAQLPLVSGYQNSGET